MRAEDDISKSSVPEVASGRLPMLVAKDGSKQLVSEQVADFVNWLKAQGAI